MKIVHSYNQPDIDGVSCMYAYSQLLNKQSEKADYFIWDMPKQEVNIICDMFGITLNNINEEIPGDNEIVLVDFNALNQTHSSVKPEKIIEIIDHHSISKDLYNYKNIQRIQIDKIGAAATIVTERYKNSGFIPSREVAILLFYGIISNSINLKSNNTTKRDIDACKWLKSICTDISEEKIKDIFIRKSYIEDKNLRFEMECEIPNVFPKCKTIIAQLEVANLEKFLLEKKNKIISIMKDVKNEKQIDFIFINCIDILNGYTIIFGVDEETNKFITKIFEYNFNENNVIKIDKVIQRKELTAILSKNIYKY